VVRGEPRPALVTKRKSELPPDSTEVDLPGVAGNDIDVTFDQGGG
jgi:hypothetical protein